MKLSGPTYWMLAAFEDDRTRALTIDRGGKRALPVFGFREEAAMFLGSGAFEDCWRPRETPAEELLSVLYGPCRNAEWVTLDPLPEALTRRGRGAVLLSRARFAAFLMRETRALRTGQV